MSLRLSRDQSHHGGTTIYPVQRVDAVNVMDEARPAAKKERPKRSVIVLTSLFLSFFGMVVFVLMDYRYGSVIKQLLGNMRSSGKLPVQATRDEHVGTKDTQRE
jgi:hypothetical protein